MGLDVSVPFTRDVAVRAGVTDAKLRRRATYRRMFRGVYLGAAVEVTFRLWLLAALLASPPGSVVSHVTALRWWGLDLGPERPLHVSTRAASYSRRDGLTIHRRQDPIDVVAVRGIPVTEPDRTIVDLAYDVTVPELIQAIEWAMHQGLTTFDRLARYALDHHLRGVRRVRDVIGFVREGSESPRETLVRLMIRFAHLPEPAPNVVLRDDDGRFLARGDLVYERWKVLVEYDGWHHERDAGQRQSDIGRRERLEQAGWRLIIVTTADVDAPRTIVERVHAALVDRGYTGPAPAFSITWTRWFPTKEEH